jgi:hypothetical protein
LPAENTTKKEVGAPIDSAQAQFGHLPPYAGPNREQFKLETASQLDSRYLHFYTRLF